MTVRSASRPSGRALTRFDPSLALYALLAYVPLLLTAPGKIAADTKAYLYLDPSRLLASAGWLWDQDIAAGTITHQNIGYLFPMGPYYWLFDQLGVPDWIAQRLWLGTILLAAGAGVRWLAHRLDLRGAPAFVAGLVYLASPYIVPYFGRTSALLLPWAALPWLIGLVIVSLRTGRWRAPVVFAIVLTLVGGTNASSVVFVALGPLLWVPYAIWVLHEVDVRGAARAIVRLAVTTIPAQLWWIAGLRMQGRYGLPILKLTESVQTVAQTSSAAEVSRGLGYWYDYGRDGLSPWTAAAQGYTQHLWLLATSFAIPFLALLAACAPVRCVPEGHHGDRGRARVAQHPARGALDRPGLRPLHRCGAAGDVDVVA
jgi:arabinofuranan 3-O-arabinosyltransferase